MDYGTHTPLQNNDWHCYSTHAHTHHLMIYSICFCYLIHISLQNDGFRWWSWRLQHKTEAAWLLYHTLSCWRYSFSPALKADTSTPGNLESQTFLTSTSPWFWSIAPLCRVWCGNWCWGRTEHAQISWGRGQRGKEAESGWPECPAASQQRSWRYAASDWSKVSCHGNSECRDIHQNLVMAYNWSFFVVIASYIIIINVE